jgi:hypothetical protein
MTLQQNQMTTDSEVHYARNSGRGFTIASFVCAVVAVFLLPIVFGPLGIVFGVVAHRRGDALGRTAIIVSAVCMVAGFILAGILLSNANNS